MVDIVHRIGIKASPAQVYRAVTTLEGLRGWWTRHTEGDSAVSSVLTFTFLNPSDDVIGEMGMRVNDLQPDTHAAWTCETGPSDWIGTTFTFDLSEEDGQTIVLFGHRGWQETTPSYAHCSMKWATFLLSLRQYVETGQGAPAPDDLKIDNWN